MRLTEKQAYYLKHIARNQETSEHAMARTLEKKGLVVVQYKRQITEWGRNKNQMSVCSITPLGRSECLARGFAIVTPPTLRNEQ